MSRRTSGVEQLACNICNRSFGRVEHLRRHVKSHGPEKPFVCVQCGKSFHRVDTLQRHELIHKEQGQSALTKKVRACYPCAAARARCAGGLPCTRCSQKSLECKGPDNRRANSRSESVISLPEESRPISLLPAQPQGPSPSIGHLLNPIRSHETGSQAVLPTLDVVFADDQLDSPSQTSPTMHTPPSATSLQASGILDGAPVQHNQFAATILRAPDQTSMQIELSELERSSGLNWLPMIYTSPQSGDFDPASFPSPSDSYYDTSLLNERASRILDRTDQSHLQTATSVPDPSNQGTEIPRRNSEPGQFYIDGEGGRLPTSGRRRVQPRLPKENLLISVDALCRNPHKTILGFPDVGLSCDPQSLAITSELYAIFLECFNFTCIAPNMFFDPFTTAGFLSREAFGHLFNLAVENFLPLIPIVHAPLLDVKQAPWLLTLAICSLGVFFVSDCDESERLAVSMQEFLRRAIFKTDNQPTEHLDAVVMTQIRLMNAIGMAYCGDSTLNSLAFAQRSELMTFCEAEWKAQETFPVGPTEIVDIVTKWQRWRLIEERRRVGYAVWLLDCMYAFDRDLQPTLSLDHCDVPLPCQEVLWEAESARAWNALYESSATTPTLIQATQRLYVEKKVQWTTGEFSRILLIHALIHRTWEVEAFVKTPLSRWLPTAARPELSANTQLATVWLPGVPLFSKWRNAACDSLDTLHWSANSLIGAASGLEHPTVLHLHLSRIILLTPFRTIRKLARATVNGQASDGNSAADDLREIRKWVSQDQYKARLAVIHAGVTFWHVRRYSSSGFYEPQAVALAALALWAYGTFSKPKRKTRHESASSDSEDTRTTTAQVDRPMDDELVQLFVRHGARMQASMTGVGDLCGVKGPERVLVEGSKIIATLANWGCAREHYRLLNDLAQILRQQRQEKDTIMS